jgi:uncharacterized protein (DUF58 family)
MPVRIRARLQGAMAAWIRRRQGADQLPVRLHRRRIYILPTRAGAAFAVLVFFMLLAGLNYANSLALLLTFVLTGFGLVALHQCHRNLLEVQLLDAATAPAFAGERGTVSLVLAAPRESVRCALEVVVAEGSRGSLDLLPRVPGRLDIAVPTTRRGVVSFGRLQLATTFPFGLFRAWAWVHVPLELIVYPRARGTRPLPPSPGSGAGSTQRSGAEEDEWFGLRPFREGDSPRQVAWKAYARGAPLMVREYAASGSDLRVFDFAQLQDLDTEGRLEQLARWIVDAESRGEGYGLRLPGRELPPDHGPEHRHLTLAALACHERAERAA